MSYLNDAEGNFCLRVNQLSRNDAMRQFFTVISKLGDGGFWALMALAMLLIQGPDALPAVAQMALTAALGVLLYKSLKNRLVRERPYMNHFGIYCATAPLDRYSFPSGHTLHASSLSTMLLMFEPALAIVAIPFAILVAASRVILGLHYPSDVIVGAAIGFSLAGISLSLL
jgi:undecaprenyl-diphosphatase